MGRVLSAVSRELDGYSPETKLNSYLQFSSMGGIHSLMGGVWGIGFGAKLLGAMGGKVLAPLVGTLTFLGGALTKEREMLDTQEERSIGQLRE